MAVISTGISKSFNIPGIPWSYLAPQFTRACRTEVYSFSKIANVTWQGSARPMILIATKRDSRNWATAQLNGYGRGIVYFTNYPTLVARMKKWTVDTWMGLFYHEMGHIMLNTWNQDIAYPPKAWFVTAMQKKWGKPKSALELAVEMVLESKIVEENADISLLDKIRGWRSPIVETNEWNGEKV